MESKSVFIEKKRWVLYKLQKESGMHRSTASRLFLNSNIFDIFMMFRDNLNITHENNMYIQTKTQIKLSFLYINTIIVPFLNPDTFSGHKCLSCLNPE